MRKLLFLAVTDFANVNTAWSHLIRTHLGPDSNHEGEKWDSRIICLEAHAFDYTPAHDFDLRTKLQMNAQCPELTEWMKDVTIICWCEEEQFSLCSHWYETGQFRNIILMGNHHLERTARWYVFHASHGFREVSEKYRPLDKLWFQVETCSPDLVRLCNPGRAIPIPAKPMKCLLDTEATGIRRNATVICVAHSPTNYKLKGTEAIRRVLNRILFEFGSKVKYVEIGGPHKEGKSLSVEQAIKERSTCHLYIDQYHSPVGGVGISTYEAMSAGILPLCTTDNISSETWQDLPGGKPPFVHLSGSEEDRAEDRFFETMRYLCSLGVSKLVERGLICAEWMKQNHTEESLAKWYHDNILRRVLTI